MAHFTHYRVHADHQLPEITQDVIIGPSKPYIETLLEKLQIQIIQLDDESIQFDLIGVDASIANALRRILLAEVRTLLLIDFIIFLFSIIILGTNCSCRNCLDCY
jgi:hypothetical protein